MKKIFLFLLLFLTGSAVYSQSLSVFDVDTSSFPVMKAKFYAFDANGNQVLNLSPSDFQITENGQQRQVLSVSCPTPKPPVALSSVLVMDKSGSMEEDFKLQSIHEAAKAWIEALPGKSECAITSFNDNNYIIQDFTTNKTLLEQKASSITADDGTNYNKALIDPMAGGILIAKNGKYKKVIIMLSDGQPNFEPNTQEIIQKARANGIIIYFVSLGYQCPQCMKDITSQTEGKYFENVTNVEEAKTFYLDILEMAQGIGPCEIEWQSLVSCIAELNDVEITWNSIKSNLFYLLPTSSIKRLSFNPPGVYFRNKRPGIETDTIIIVTADNSDFSVINVSGSSPYFSISPSNFILTSGQSINLTLSFTPPDSNNYFCIFNIDNNNCLTKYYAGAGFIQKKNITQTLKLIRPNGGEKFLVGIDTVITWEGVLPSDTVKLEYSTDNGITWNLITEKAIGLKYIWRNIPNTPSLTCLARITWKNSINVPSIEWQKSLGGSGYDVANSIQQTSDDGYIVAGWTDSNDGDVSGNHGGLGDYWIVKLNNNGIIQWQKSFGGSNEDVATSVKQTFDGGYIIAGHSNSNDGDVTGNHGNSDYWVIKLDSSGNIEWQKLIGGSWDDGAESIQQSSDSGYIVAGYSNSNDGDVSGHHGAIGMSDDDYWVVKLDNSGDIQWQKSLGGNSRDVANSIQLTNDGGYIVAGWSVSNDGDVSGNHGDCDYWVVKLDSSGNIEWQKSFGGSVNDVAQSIQQTRDGGYIVAGSSRSDDYGVIGHHGSNYYPDYWIVKLDNSGNVLWQKSFGSSGYDEAYSIQETNDDGYIVAGYTDSNDGDVSGYHGGLGDYWIVKLDNNGNILWQKSLGGSSYDVANSIQQTSDDGYIVAGWTDSNDGDMSGNHGNKDCWVVKLSYDGSDNIQQDVSDSLWAIVKPQAASKDIDMKQCLVGSLKDSVITEFITNTGSYPCRIDTIYFTGADASQFNLVSRFFPFEVPVGGTKSVEIAFQPNSVGIKNAVINIKTQADTLNENITGDGVLPVLSVLSNIIDFGKVDIRDVKDSLAFVLENISNFPINITSTTISGPDMEQFALRDNGSFTIQSGEKKQLSLRFQPKYIGRTTTDLVFDYSGAVTPARVQLYGQGIGGLVYIDDDSAYVGEVKDIRLKLSGIKLAKVQSIASEFTATLAFNSTLLAPIDKSLPKFVAKDTTFLTIRQPLTNGDYLAEFYIKAGLGNATQTDIDIVNFNWLDNSGNILDYDTQTQSGTFKILGICNEGGTRLINPDSKAGIINLAPNPTNDEVNVTFTLIEQGMTDISIYNILGEKVLTAFSENVSNPDTRSLTVSTNPLSAGAYTVIFRTPTIVESYRLMVIK